MKKQTWFLLLCCFAVLMTACKDDDEVKIDEEWKAENEEAFLKISKDPAYTELKSLGNNGSIYFKVLKEGDGKDPIYYNSRVKCYYRGELCNGTVFDKVEYPYDAPYVTYVNGVIEGWAVALQSMKVGDKWEIWIPMQLAYGYAGDGSIPGYSTLKFEVEVVEIVEP